MNNYFDTYNQVITYLFEQLPMFQRIGAVAYKANLNNTEALDKYLDYPHKNYASIHVGGTNGKGSTSHLIASTLQEAGYKTGLFTSPHLKDFRERIRVNGICISENEVIEFVNTHRNFIDTLKPSFFEMTALMALDYFAKQKVDVAVIEVGLGGRLDSTNVISPVVSCITNISLDHTALLGNSIEQIATEKAGIIKPNTPVVIGEKHADTSPIFEAKAKLCQSNISYAQDSYSIDYSTQTSTFEQVFQVYKDDKLHFANLKTPLMGLYQQKNAKTVLTVIDQLQKLNYQISTQNIYDGFKNAVKNTHLQGRWQILGYNPLIICDTGHNEEGIKQVVEQLEQTAHKQLHMVIGMVNDKAIETVLELLPKQAIYYFTQAALPRALDANLLSEMGEKIGLKGTIHKTVAEAIENAKKNATTNDLIFIGGSTFIVAEAL